MLYINLRFYYIIIKLIAYTTQATYSLKVVENIYLWYFFHIIFVYEQINYYYYYDFHSLFGEQFTHPRW